MMKQTTLTGFKKLPPLYQKAATGRIYTWSIDVVEDNNKVFMEAKYGQLDGKITTSRKEIKSGKRIGSIAETTKIGQANLEAKSKWKDKKKKNGYYETIEKATNNTFVAPMLAYTFKFESLNKKRGTNITLPAISQPKLDGWRCLSHVNIGNKNNEIIMKTRSNTEYDLKNYQHIVKELEEIKELNNGLYLDGELYTNDVPFEELGLLKKKEKSEKQNAKFKLIKLFVYDCFYLDNLKMPFIERYDILKSIVKKGKFKNIILVENRIVNTPEDIKENFADYIRDGYEGLMLRNINSPYEIDKRSKHLQKYKEFDENEFEIIGFKEASGNDKGTIVWTCITEDGKEFDVRPRGTREFRKELFKTGHKYVGKKLTVIYFGMSKYGIPRMPVGKGVREDK